MWCTPTKKQLAKIPKSQPVDSLDNIIIYMHFFVGGCDWWIAEYDGNDTFFGFACLGDPLMAEWGSISLSELRELRMQVPIVDPHSGATSHIHVEVDRDKFWQPCKFQDIPAVQSILQQQGRTEKSKALG